MEIFCLKESISISVTLVVMSCHMSSAVLSLLAKTQPTRHHGFGWTRAALR